MSTDIYPYPTSSGALTTLPIIRAEFVHSSSSCWLMFFLMRLITAISPDHSHLYWHGQMIGVLDVTFGLEITLDFFCCFPRYFWDGLCLEYFKSYAPSTRGRARSLSEFYFSASIRVIPDTTSALLSFSILYFVRSD